MNRPELIDSISDQTDLSKADVGRVISAMIDTVIGELEAGGDVRLPGFGIFGVTERGSGKGRNPRTGEAILVAATRRAKFKQARALKEALNPVRLTGARRRA